MSADLNSLLAPNDDKQFEQLCQHVLEHRFKTLWGQAYGRNGQAQHGVDFYIDAGNGVGGSAAIQIIGVQCKHKDRLHEGVLGVNEVEAEVKKAKGFTPSLTTFIIATSAPTDTKPQDKARELTAEHQKQTPPLFPVEVWFWEKIRDEFCKNPSLRREILERFYPHFISAPTAQHGNLHQLPSQPAHFTGRDTELAELEKELVSAQVLGATISGVRTKLQGAPGVGKTALATVLAHKLKDRYPDAQLYLNLRGAGADVHGQHSTMVKPVTPAEAMQSIIHSFHPEEKLPEELDKLAVKYNGVLNVAGRVLLFLDNAADAEQVRPLLPPANCLLLVTSRSQFSLPGLVSRDIDCLLPEKSQELLLKLAPRIKGHEPEAAELCGHLPLALEVFAGVVRDKKIYLVPDLLNRLREGREKLAPVEAAFQVSYDLLADDLRRRWTLLAVFPASFDLAAAAAIWAEGRAGSPLPAEGVSHTGGRRARSGAPYQQIPDSASDAMQTLVNASLVEWNEANGRFRLHDLVRQFCDGKLAESERNDAKLRHATHYRNVARKAEQLYLKGGENVVRGLALFDCERTQLEEAFVFLTDVIKKSVPAARDANNNPSQSQAEDCQPFPQSVVVAATLLDSLVDVVAYTSNLRFHPHQSIDWLEAKRDAAYILKNRQSASVALVNLGIAYANLGDARKATEFYEQALVMKRLVGDRRGESSALLNLSVAYTQLGYIRKAIVLCDQALVIDCEIGNRRGESANLSGLGYAYARLGDISKAIICYERALVIVREIGDRREEGATLGNLGTAYSVMGDMRKAISFHEQSRDIAREIGNRKGEASTLGNLGIIYAKLGDICKAIEFYEQALVIYRKMGDKFAEANCCWNYALALNKLGDRLQAIQWAEAALKIREAIEDPNAAKVRAALAEWRK